MAASSLLLVCFIYLRARNPGLKGAARFVLLSQVILVVQSLLTMKQAGGLISETSASSAGSSLRYMVPALAASAVSSSIALAAVGAVRARLNAFGFVAVLSMAAPQMTMNLNQYMTDSYEKFQIENVRLAEMGSAICARIIPYKDLGSQPYALFWGNGGAGGRFDADLAHLYPNFMIYIVSSTRFATFSGDYDASQLAGFPHSKSFCLSGTTELPFHGYPNVRFIGSQGKTKLYELLQQ
jgi:hypothetical protein